MDWMHPKQRRHNGAPPDHAGHPPENHEHQQRIGHVKPQTHQVMRPGVHAEQLAVQHVRPPHQRMPVLVIDRVCAPNDAFPRKSIPDKNIVKKDVGVVVLQKAETTDVPVHSNCCRRQSQTNQQHLPNAGSFAVIGWIWSHAGSFGLKTVFEGDCLSNGFPGC